MIKKKQVFFFKQKMSIDLELYFMHVAVIWRSGNRKDFLLCAGICQEFQNAQTKDKG